MKVLGWILAGLVGVAAMAVLFFPLPQAPTKAAPGAASSMPTPVPPTAAPTAAPTATSTPKAASAAPGAESRYGVVFDAGSTGTRVHVYRFSHIGPAVAGAHEGSDNFHLDDELNTENDIGLSSLASQSPADMVAGVRNILEPLMRAAADYVPRELHGKTTVTLRATAGLRLLSETAADALIAAAANVLKSSPFVFGSCSIISGTEEGVWAWLTVNYMLGRLGPKASATVAVMDLGGASTQFVFEPRREELNKFLAENPERSSLFYKLSFAGRQYMLYEKSHLRYGLMEARRRGNFQAATDGWTVASNAQRNGEVDASHPCLPAAHFNGFEATPLVAEYRGFQKLSQFKAKSAKADSPRSGKPAAPLEVDVDTTRPGAEKFQLRGGLQATSEQCIAWTTGALFNRNPARCPAMYGGSRFCPFDGAFQPPLNSPEWFDATGYADGDDAPAVYAFSYFYDRALAMDLVAKPPLSVVVSIEQWIKAADETCSHYAAGTTDAVQLWIKTNPYLCYDVQYIAALLHHAYGLPMNSRLTLAKKIDGKETGWCLGSVLHDLFDDQ